MSQNFIYKRTERGSNRKLVRKSGELLDSQGGVCEWEPSGVVGNLRKLATETKGAQETQAVSRRPSHKLRVLGRLPRAVSKPKKAQRRKEEKSRIRELPFLSPYHPPDTHILYTHHTHVPHIVYTHIPQADTHTPYAHTTH